MNVRPAASVLTVKHEIALEVPLDQQRLQGCVGVDAMMVSTFGGQARALFNFTADNVTVDGQAYDAQPGEFDLADIPAGTHTMTWDDNGKSETWSFGSGSAAMVSVFLRPKIEKPSIPHPSKPPEPAPKPVESQNSQINGLLNQAYAAYQKGHYAEPVGDNWIYYLNKALGLDTNNKWARDTIDSRIYQEAVLIHSALNTGDLTAARRMVDALVALLPDDSRVQDLQTQVKPAEDANRPQPPPPAPKPVLSRQANYIFNKRTYPGALTVLSEHLKFEPQALPNGPPPVDIPCAGIRDVHQEHKTKFRVLVASGGKYEFESHSVIGSEVESACKK